MLRRRVSVSRQASGSNVPVARMHIHHFLSAISSEPEILSGKITAVLPKDASGLTSVTLENDGDAPELID